VPDIQILEEKFDFGSVTLLSESQAIKMTIRNNSDIAAKINLDLRSEESMGIDCLKFAYVDESND